MVKRQSPAHLPQRLRPIQDEKVTKGISLTVNVINILMGLGIFIFGINKGYFIIYTPLVVTLLVLGGYAIAHYDEKKDVQILSSILGLITSFSIFCFVFYFDRSSNLLILLFLQMVLSSTSLGLLKKNN